MWGIIEIIQFLLSDKHLDGAGRSLRHTLDKVKLWHFHITSKFQIICRLKSAILVFFQTGPGLPRTVIGALKNPSEDFKKVFALGANEFLTMV